MAYEYHYQRLVHWQDTDLAGIIHYANYFRYMDEAETEFYRSVGLHKLTDSRQEGVMCPRVSAACDFIKPVTFGDELDVHTWISKKGRSSIVFECSFKLGEEDCSLQAPADSAGSDRGHRARTQVARGRVTAVFVSKGPDGKMKPVAMPERFDRLFEVAPFAPEASAG